METKRKVREEDGLLTFGENKRSKEAEVERRKGIDAERLAEVEHNQRREPTPAPTDSRARHRGRSSGSEYNRNTRDEDNRESSRTNSKARREFSRWGTLESAPQTDGAEDQSPTTTQQGTVKGHKKNETGCTTCGKST